MNKRNRIHWERPRVIVETLSPRWLKVSIAGFFLMLLPLAAALLTYYFFGSEERQFTQDLALQRAEIAELSDQLKYAEQMRANAEIASEVDRQAMAMLREELVSWNIKHDLLEEKINFYQSLMDPNPINSGVYIESAEIRQAGDERSYNFSVLVAQRSSNHAGVTGTLFIEILSSEDSDGVQSLSLEELTDDGDELTLGFKFFQQLEGAFVLPEGFDPERLRLVLEVKGRSSARVEELTDWVVRS